MKHMNYAKRSLAVFLALVMCVGLLQLPAFAADEGFKSAAEAGVNKDEIPEGSLNSSTRTNPDGSDTRDDSWDYNYSPDDVESVTGSGTDKDGNEVDGDKAIDNVDSLVGGNYDDVEDGTYTKKEEHSNTDDARKQGGETRNDKHEDDGNGNLLDSGSVDGWETTTKSSSETTTTGEKNTSEYDEENMGDLEDVDIVVDGEEGKLGDQLDHDSDIQVDLDTSKEYEPNDGDLTVTEGKSDEINGKIVYTGDTKKDLLKALDGWTVYVREDSASEYAGKAVTVHVNGDEVTFTYQGKTVNVSIDEIEFEVTESQTENGNDKHDFNLKAEKTNSYELANPESLDTVVQGLLDAGYVLRDDGRYVKVETVNGVEVTIYYTLTFTTKGTIVVTQYAEVSATLTEGNYTLGAEMSGITDLPELDDLYVFGPNSNGKQLTEADAKKWNGIEYKDFDNKYDRKDAVAEGEWYLTGKKLCADIDIKTSRDSAKATMFELTDGKGHYMYVYCVEHGKQVWINDGYDLEGADDHPVYDTQSANIQYVVENGWWGTSSGAGSLEQIKAFLKANKGDSGLSDADIEKYLTDAIAMTVTQAALWTYTSSERPTGEKDVKNFGTPNGNFDLSGISETIAKQLYKLLTSETATKKNTSEEVAHEGDLQIESASVTIKEKIESREDLDKMVAESQEQYKADISLAVVASKFDRVMVYVYVGNDLARTVEVTQEELKANNGKITISGITLADGQTISFKVEGIQYLESGAYVFSSTDSSGKTTSQTMVGNITSGIGGKKSTHTVAKEFEMTFTISENAASASSSGSITGATAVTVTTTVTEADITTKEYVEWHDEWEIPGEYTVGDDDDDDDGDIGDDDDDDDDVFIGDDDVPLSDWDEDFDLDMPDVPLANMDEDDELMDIEMDVPLSGVPHTGDESDIWTYVAIFSAIGMAALFVIERKKREEA